MISGNALLAGVIGDPVAHSLSPLLHNHWLNELAIDGAYIPLHVRAEHLSDAVRVLPALGFRGWNVTVPHKEAMLSLVDEADDTAKTIGAVNTVTVLPGGKLFGGNTDSEGFAANLRPHLKRTGKAVILGAGGASRAVVHALQTLGFTDITLTNRTRSRAEEIASIFGKIVSVAEWNDRANMLGGADLLVNTTTLGLHGQPPLDLPLAALPAGALVTDIVYVPRITPLLAQASAQGFATVDGLGMLIYQAVPGFRAWFGQTPRIAENLWKVLAP
jgi:shikimate dehydrogenase